jgi:fructose/tagatose bisphosphate aldolase
LDIPNEAKTIKAWPHGDVNVFPEAQTMLFLIVIHADHCRRTASVFHKWTYSHGMIDMSKKMQ